MATIYNCFFLFLLLGHVSGELAISLDEVAIDMPVDTMALLRTHGAPSDASGSISTDNNTSTDQVLDETYTQGMPFRRIAQGFDCAGKTNGVGVYSSPLGGRPKNSRLANPRSGFNPGDSFKIYGPHGGSQARGFTAGTCAKRCVEETEKLGKGKKCTHFVLGTGLKAGACWWTASCPSKSRNDYDIYQVTCTNCGEANCPHCDSVH
jgi:hypothetical protein